MHSAHSSATHRHPVRGAIIWAVLMVVLIVATAVANFALTQRNDYRDYSPHSLEPRGSAALATLLRQEGIEIIHVQTPAQLSSANAHTTILVTDPSSLVEKDAQHIIESGATVILVGSAITWEGAMWGFDENTWVSAYYTEAAASLAPEDAAKNMAVRETHCPGDLSFIDPSTGHSTLAPIDQIMIGADPDHSCFRTLDGAGIVQSEKNPRVFYVGASYALTNQYLDQEDNAGVALRMLSAHPQLLWVEGYQQPYESPTTDSPMPPWLIVTFIALAISALWFAVWKGRRYGRLVPEPLPVVVPADEANQGRARLYRASRDPAYAAHVLRAGFIARHAKRIGVNRHTSPDDIVQACAEAIGADMHMVKSALYTYPVNKKEDIAHVASALGALEKEFTHAYQR